MLWGGRFDEKLNHNAMEFSSSFYFDKNLFDEDILVDYSHARMLNGIGLLTDAELGKIIDGLARIKKEWDDNFWKPGNDKFEDVHSAIESRLFELIGPVAGKLHTGRSRNDQIATVMKLWIKKSSAAITKEIKKVQVALLTAAENHTGTIMPGYTHLQRAQPISLAFHLLAYVEMLARDYKRFLGVIEECNTCPLGSGALAGSTLPLDRDASSEELNFTAPTANALDSVSDRDFMIDFMHACSMGMMHLSRFAEELILWTSAEWNFVRLSDKYTTGSSLMPQKKNSDMAELVRGKTGKVFGNQFALLATMKGLPLSYNRDLQEDKLPVFSSFETYIQSLGLIAEMVLTMEVNKERFIEELKGDFIFATDLADWLVLKGIPFREAHHIVGALVKKLEMEKKKFSDADLDYLKSVNSIFDESAFECFNVETCLDRKKTYGSPNRAFVKKEIEIWKERLKAGS